MIFYLPFVIYHVSLNFFNIFLAPFPKTITCIIKFTNKVEGVVAFKIKSKHAKKYSVKPKEGILGPLENEKIEFSISKDFEEIPLSDDKFKVECVRILNPKEIKDEKNAVAEAVSWFGANFIV